MSNLNNKIRLKVSKTNPKFVGTGMALVDPKVMEEIGLSTGGVIEISGKNKMSNIENLMEVCHNI
jgi:transitional endoplasmic reticulum ATPase